jgi:hypothetical protein
VDEVAALVVRYLEGDKSAVRDKRAHEPAGARAASSSPKDRPSQARPVRATRPAMLARK